VILTIQLYTDPTDPTVTLVYVQKNKVRRRLCGCERMCSPAFVNSSVIVCECVLTRRVLC
jgi:hypothetical protein